MCENVILHEDRSFPDQPSFLDEPGQDDVSAAHRALIALLAAMPLVKICEDESQEATCSQR